MNTPNTQRPLDRHDLKLLGLFGTKQYKFPKAHQEFRASLLAARGLLEKNFMIHKVLAGGREIDMRPAFRRTEEGSAALRAVASSGAEA